MKVTIYRLENNNHAGPFTSGLLYQYVDTLYDDPCKFPNPHNDGINLYHNLTPEAYFCGCRSLRQLLHWFPAKVIRKMRQELHFGIAVYEVDTQQVLYGSKQVMFTLFAAKRILFK